jgi:hypothetical protein
MEVVEYRPQEDGLLQLKLRRYLCRGGSTRDRGPYWYFQFHEGGKRKKLYLGKTSDQGVLWPQSEHRPSGSGSLLGVATKSVDPKDAQTVRAQVKDWARSMPRGSRGWATRTSTTPIANQMVRST